MTDFSHLMGYHYDPKEIDLAVGRARVPYMGPVAQAICGSGKGKIQLLFKCVRQVVGHDIILEQAIGDCVAFGLGGATNTLKATEIVIGKEAESWGGETSTEDIYGGSRVQIGRGQLGNGDGSIGAWAVEYASKYGTLVRKKYGNIDLSVYSGARARQWGSPRAGTPAELLPFAREHTIKTYSVVRTYEEARDALYNGYPITIASNRGFNNVRDKDGFGTGRANWPHQMYLCGVDDESGRPGVLCMNSWGASWISGPKRHDQPDGSFWIDAQTLERDILSGGDSWAISGFDGYPPNKIDWAEGFL